MFFSAGIGMSIFIFGDDYQLEKINFLVQNIGFVNYRMVATNTACYEPTVCFGLC